MREAIAPMKLGLWMSPMSFNPQSQAYPDHPEWACLPLGHGTALVQRAQPDSGSNEAGIGLWSTGRDPARRVAHPARRSSSGGSSTSSSTSCVWLDCAGNGDIYAYNDAFVAMLDRLRRDHPEVTFQIDETNDYRLFPFESVARGPSWFQNGSPAAGPAAPQHLEPEPVGARRSRSGQHFLGGAPVGDHSVDTLMAVALLSHLTFFSDLRELPAEVIDAAAPWIDFYRRHRDLLDGVVYPLLADPLGKGWTALQSWDPERGEGALLAFRQDARRLPTQRIALRNVPPGRTFKLRRAPDGAPAGTVTSAQLSAGIDVTVPEAGRRDRAADHARGA